MNPTMILHYYLVLNIYIFKSQKHDFFDFFRVILIMISINDFNQTTLLLERERKRREKRKQNISVLITTY